MGDKEKLKFSLASTKLLMVVHQMASQKDWLITGISCEDELLSYITILWFPDIRTLCTAIRLNLRFWCFFEDSGKSRFRDSGEILESFFWLTRQGRIQGYEIPILDYLYGSPLIKKGKAPNLKYILILALATVYLKARQKYKNQDSNHDSRIVISLENPAQSRFQRFKKIQHKTPGQTRVTSRRWVAENWGKTIFLERPVDDLNLTLKPT